MYVVTLTELLRNVTILKDCFGIPYQLSARSSLTFKA
jgi:hypothetical protein